MNREQLFDILRPIVLSTGVPGVVLYDPDGQPPTGEYASVEPFYSITPRGQGGQLRTPGQPVTLSVSVVRQVDVVAAVNFYRGDDPAAYAARLVGVDELPVNATALRAAGVRWVSVDNIADRTTVLGAQYSSERRARAEIRVIFNQIVQTELDRIASADVEVQDASGNVLLPQGA